MNSERASSAYIREQSGLTTDERIGSLFQPSSLLSAEYFEALRRKTILEPEKRLMLAILEDAVDCFQNNIFTQSVKGRRLFQEAEKWVVEVDGDWVFSFENVCETLELNPAYVRQGLLRCMPPPPGAESRLHKPTGKKRKTNESSARKRRRFRRQSSWREPIGPQLRISKEFEEDLL
jgi:hypothetical protein